MLPLFHIENCHSTQDEILIKIKELRIPLAVSTYHQTKGRGQYGNQWHAPKNKNLAYSIALKVNDFQMPDSLFNFHTASIFRKIIANMTNVEVKIKWPNDLIIKGKKIAGMLIEKQKIYEDWFYIIGIGINVLQENFSGLPKAGSLLTQVEKKYDLDLFTEKLHLEFQKMIKISIDNSGILDEFNFHLFRKDEISVFECNNLRQNGIIKYADEEGFLWIDLEFDGLQKFNNKEIALLY